MAPMSTSLVGQNAIADQFKAPAVHAALALLTSRQRAFVLAIMISGLSTNAAAVQAGYSTGNQGYVLMKNPNVVNAIAAMQTEYAHDLELGMEEVKQGMLDAIDVARATNNAMAMIAGWREIGKLIGAYVEPEKLIKIDISDTRSLESVPTVKLYEMLEEDEDNILEGELVGDG